MMYTHLIIIDVMQQERFYRQQLEKKTKIELNLLEDIQTSIKEFF